MYQLFISLQTNQTFAMFLFAVVGLCVGSFLNVVIYRVPKIMHKEWRVEAIHFISEEKDLANIIGKNRLSQLQSCIVTDKTLTLSKPASHCPNCKQKISWYHNIPLISWLVLAGKCHYCKQPISSRYPLIEILTALLSALVIYKLGITGVGLTALVFVWGLIALAGIDWNTQLLPNRITYPLATLGLLVNSQLFFTGFVSPTNAIWGLAIGFLSLWSVNQVFYLMTKKQGMGQGDFKLLAAIGCWLGVGVLPLVILLSAVLGVLVGLILMVKNGKSQPFAFGPFIAVAAIVAILYGGQMVTWYMGLFML